MCIRDRVYGDRRFLGRHHRRPSSVTATIGKVSANSPQSVPTVASDEAETSVSTDSTPSPTSPANNGRYIISPKSQVSKKFAHLICTSCRNSSPFSLDVFFFLLYHRLYNFESIAALFFFFYQYISFLFQLQTNCIGIRRKVRPLNISNKSN